MNILKFSLLICFICLNAKASHAFDIKEFFAGIFKIFQRCETSYKLTYFDIRGRAEFIRVMFAAAGQKYEDYRVLSADWPRLKPATPFGQVPILEICEGLLIII